MDLKQNVSLRDYSTMRLGGTATYLCDVHNRQEVEQAIQWAHTHSLPMIMIGGGSNIVWTDGGFNGLVIVNKILRFETFEEDSENVYITVGAGEIWDSVVNKSVELGLTGIEALSLIPGSVGATPIQNVGAYGQEIADTLVSVEAYDLKDKKYLTIPNADCGFGYRTSRFKSKDKGRFLITAITLHLRRGNPTPPFYSAVQDYFVSHKINQPTAADLRHIVIDIRTHKLPDPARVANCGSFFANPIITDDQLNDLLAHYPNISYWQQDNRHYKLAAAWLVEQAGFKATHDKQTGMATWPTQALVLVNEHARNTADLLAFKQKIVKKVQSMFGITLQQEPELLGHN
jgi:UDP-N-acetylmuramate dehydrogenase